MTNPTRLIAKLVIVVGIGFSLTACASFRLHDAGRLSTSTEAVQLSSELSTGGQAVFDPMEQNLDTVPDVQAKIAEKLRAHELETFKAIVAESSAADIAHELVEAMDDRYKIVSRLLQSEASAAEAVNAALDRQQAITVLVDKPIKDKSKLAEALKRVDKRLKWIRKRLDFFVDLREQASKSTTVSDALGSLSDEDTQGAEKVKDILGKARNAIDQIEKDERATAALKLLQQAGQEIASAEQSRLLEMRRHLGEIGRVKATFAVRDEMAVCDLLDPAIANVYPVIAESETRTIRELQDGIITLPTGRAAGLPDGPVATLPNQTYHQLNAQLVKEKELNEKKKRGHWTRDQENQINRALRAVELRDRLFKLKWTDRLKGNDRRYSCLDDYDDDPTRWRKLLEETWERTVAHWRKDTLADYVAVDLADDESKHRSPEFVASLGILLFHEMTFLERLDLQVARESHRHSILLSKINAQQRADLVHQLAQSLKIYYQGGVKPEQVAELGLLAAQVGALVFIGAGQ